jgi:hypothetical protein
MTGETIIEIFSEGILNVADGISNVINDLAMKIGL